MPTGAEVKSIHCKGITKPRKHYSPSSKHKAKNTTIMNTNPVIPSERKNADVTNSPLKLAGYLNRRPDVTPVPSENTSLLFPSITRNRNDSEAWRRNISNVTTTAESKFDLGGSTTENEALRVDYEHSANVNVTAAGVVATLYIGENLQAGDGDMVEDGGRGGDNLPPLLSPSDNMDTRESHVYFGSEDGLVHMGMRPRHTLKKQLRVDEEFTELSTQTYEETTMNTQEILESSSVAPEIWMTDTPGAENWITESPQDRLTINKDQNIEIIEINQESSTKIPEERPTSTVEFKDLFTFPPEEHLTTPEDWPTTTQQTEDDWLTFIPQEEEELIHTQDDLHSASLLTPIPLSLSPTLSSSLPPSFTPTLPPSLPPTPSPQDAVEDTFRITTRGLDFLLEASPTGQSSPDTTEFPKDDLFTLDLTITTTREGLQVDARDVTFDPSQIAKATSYEGSSYPTATRSATVTTTWVDEDQPTTLDPQSVRVNPRNDDLVNPTSVDELTDLSREDMDTSTLPMDDELMFQLNKLPVDSQTSDNILSTSDSTTHTHPPTTEENNNDTTTLPSNTEDQERERNSMELPTHTFGYEIHQETNTTGHNISSFPVPMTNITEARNDNNSTAKGSDSKEETVLYEIPVVTRNTNPQLSPSVVVALSVCCAAVLVLAALSVTLWICRRHRNRSKIYLSREAAKPRAFFTRPMNPAVLPEDSDREDGVYMFEFQRPRPPILLGNDQKGIYFIKRDEGVEECRASLGVENEAFTDVPLSGAEEEGGTRLDPPKYDLRSKQDGDADSGIRVWSSTGSLHAAASPLPTHCRVPPPPYSPSISKESVCLTVHSLPSLPRNSQLFDV